MGGCKCDIYAPLKDEINLLNTKLVEEYIKEHRFDVIIHTANYGKKDSDNPEKYLVLKNGLQMFFNIERCHDYFGKMFYFGSGAEFDSRHYIPFMKEEYFGKYIPDDPYGFYKYTLAKYTNNAENVYNLRLFGVVGKYEQRYRFISDNVCRALQGDNLYVNQHCYFDYISVNDLTDILAWFINNTPKYKHYNICRGEHIDLYELAFMIRSKFDNRPDVILRNDGWNKEYSGDNTRLKNEMGQLAFSSYEDIINELIEFRCYSM